MRWNYAGRHLFSMRGNARILPVDDLPFRHDETNGSDDSECEKRQ